MKKYILDCTSVKTDRDFWELYCEVIQPEGKVHFGRNLDAFRDAVSAGGPGWPGECQIELIHVNEFARRNAYFYQGLRGIADNLTAYDGVKILVPNMLR
jgi:Barstar (barnase inhibitor)